MGTSRLVGEAHFATERDNFDLHNFMSDELEVQISVRRISWRPQAQVCRTLQ